MWDCHSSIAHERRGKGRNKRAEEFKTLRDMGKEGADENLETNGSLKKKKKLLKAREKITTRSTTQRRDHLIKTKKRRKKLIWGEGAEEKNGR